MKQNKRWAVTLATLGLATCGVVATGASSSVAGTLQGHRLAPHLVRHAPGYWTELAKTLGATYTGTPAVWLAPDHSATVLWERHIHNTNYTYEDVLVDAAGTAVGAPVSIFGGTGWVSLLNDPILVSDGSSPEMIFNGARTLSNSDPYSKGCVYGAVAAKPQWTLQGWSLSNDCYNPIPGGTETRTGELSAAWGGSSGGHSAVLYRIGTSITIPAKGPDEHVLTVGLADIGRTAEASDIAGNDNVYVAWDQFFSKPSGDDGFYVKDATSNGPVRKAPGSGTNSVGNLFSAATVAMTNTNTHSGIFLAYCSSGPTCSLRLWRVGASKALTVPHSSPASDVAISAGPDGRIWVAWYNHSTNDVSTVRTNTADTAFGPVETYATPCFEDGLIGLSGGSYGRLDVALQCVDNAQLRTQDYITQSLAGLSIRASQTVIKNDVSNTVTFEVTDAGDPVAGATVRVDGRVKTTGGSGTVSITFPKGSATGKYAVTASATNYFSAHGDLDIKG
jgi:hypothetical protein